MKLNYNYIQKVLSFIIFPASFLLITSRVSGSNNYVCSANNLIPHTIIKSIHVDSTIKNYLALGDSYTIGESVQEENRFPVQLVQMLRGQNINISDPEIIAVTGWTTGDLLNSLRKNPPGQTYSFVTLLIGVNNQYQGRSLKEYKTQFTELLNLAISYADNNKDHVFVLSIPDYSVTPFASKSNIKKIAKEIDEFNETNKIISLNEGTHYLDITPISRNAKNDPSLIAADGLHPSAKQYFQWDQLLEPLIQNEIH